MYKRQLSSYYPNRRKTDVDVMVVYRPDADLSKLTDAVNALFDQGLRVRTEQHIPDGLRYQTLLRFNGETLEEVASHA